MGFSVVNYLFLGAGLVIGYALGAIFWVPIGEAKQENKYTKAVVEEVKQNAKTKKKVNALTNDELKSEYCHWVYDVPYDQCVRTNIYVD